MTAQYTLSEDHHLTYQLYRMSRSQEFRRAGNRGSIPFLLLFLLLAFSSIWTSKVLAVLFACIAVAYYLFFPRYIRSLQPGRMRAPIREQFRKMIDRPIQVDLTDESFFIKLGSTETRTPLTDLEKIVELPTIVITEFQSGQITTLPKHQNADTDAVIEKLKESGSTVGAKYVDRLDWKWNK